MVAEENLSRLLLLLYEGVSSPERMQAFLAELIASVNATGAIFREHTFTTEENFHIDTADLAETIGYSDEALKDYLDQFWEVDIYLQRALERYRTADCGVSQLLTKKYELQRHVFYDEYLRRYDVGPMMWGKFAERPDYHASISIVRPLNADYFDQSEIEMLTALTPHLRQALDLSRTLRGLKQTNAMLARGLNDAGIAICMARQDGTILRSTEGAERIFAAKDKGITLRGGRLRVLCEHEQHALDALIAGACFTGANRGLDSPVPVESQAAGNTTVRSWTAQAGGAILVTRKPPRPPLQVIVSPFCPGTLLNEPQATALIQFSDPSAVPKPRAAILRALYKLSPTESRLADLLLQGLEVREAAERLNVSFETARFYLKQVLRKTGTGRQTELIRLMLSLPGA